MKRFIKEIILLLQIYVFYICPLFAGPTELIGLVFFIIIATFILSILIGSILNEKIKYLYPIVIAILFIPTVFIHYNESAFVHSIWYLVISYVGVIIGTIINKVIRLINKK